MWEVIQPEKVEAYLKIEEAPLYIEELNVNEEKGKTKLKLIYEDKKKKIETEIENFAYIDKYNFIEYNEHYDL